MSIGAGRHRLRCSVVGGKFANLQLDAPQRFLGGRIVDRGNGGDRLAAVAHPVARQRMLAARDRKHTEGLVAIGAGDDRLHTGKLRRLGNIHVEDFSVRIRTAKNAPSEHARHDKIGGVLGASGNFFRAVDHRHVFADVMCRHDLVHGDSSAAQSSAACCTASMILT